MATVNVYVPEDLKEQLDSGDLNLSALARECWEAALTRADLPKEEVSVETMDRDGNEIELRFTGSLIAESDAFELYLTDDDRVVFVDDEGFHTAERDEVDEDQLWRFFKKDQEAIATACSVLGIRRVVEL